MLSRRSVLLLAVTPESARALSLLRRVDGLQWTALVALSLAVYAYARAAARGDRKHVALGLGFLFLEAVWEMLNGLVLHFSQHAALWTVAKESSFVIYVGLNVEIWLMFAIMPLVLFDLLPKDPAARVLGLPSRIVVPIALGLFAVAAETALNAGGALVWSWRFWGWPHLLPIAVVYCAPLWGLARLHDRLTERACLRFLAGSVALAVTCHLVLATGLGWV